MSDEKPYNKISAEFRDFVALVVRRRAETMPPGGPAIGTKVWTCRDDIDQPDTWPTVSRIIGRDDDPDHDGMVMYEVLLSDADDDMDTIWIHWTVFEEHGEPNRWEEV